MFDSIFHTCIQKYQNIGDLSYEHCDRYLGTNIIILAWFIPEYKGGRLLENVKP